MFFYSICFGAFFALIGICVICSISKFWGLQTSATGAVVGGFIAVCLLCPSNKMLQNTPYGDYFNGDIGSAAIGAVMMLGIFATLRLAGKLLFSK
jgi:hypothetical protein